MPEVTCPAFNPSQLFHLRKQLQRKTSLVSLCQNSHRKQNKWVLCLSTAGHSKQEAVIVTWSDIWSLEYKRDVPFFVNDKRLFLLIPQQYTAFISGRLLVFKWPRNNHSSKWQITIFVVGRGTKLISTKLNCALIHLIVLLTPTPDIALLRTAGRSKSNWERRTSTIV